MSEPLTPATIAIVKATVPALAEHGTAITTAMYARLFQDEHIKALFEKKGEADIQLAAPPVDVIPRGSAAGTAAPARGPAARSKTNGPGEGR